MPKGLCKTSKRIIASLLDYFEEERDNRGPILPLTSVRERVAAATKISLTTVSRVSSSLKRNQPLSSPKRKRNNIKPVVNVDEASKRSIRNVIYEMYHNRQHVTRQSLLVLLKEGDIFLGGITSLGTILREIDFPWRKDDPRRGLIELPHIVLTRINFLQACVNSHHVIH